MQHCVPDWDGTGLPSPVWTLHNWGAGARIALFWGPPHGYTGEETLAVMKWARDQNLKVGDDEKVQSGFVLLTGRKPSDSPQWNDPPVNLKRLPPGIISLPVDPKTGKVTRKIDFERSIAATKASRAKKKKKPLPPPPMPVQQAGFAFDGPFAAALLGAAAFVGGAYYLSNPNRKKRKKKRKK